MNRRWTTTIAVGTLLIAASGSAQVTDTGTTVVARFVDRINGLSLDQAIARAIELEPSLRSARSAIDVAKGMRQQAALRPSPSASFERREEPSGTDNQTMVAVEWPLDLFRKSGRVTVADREVAAARRECRLTGSTPAPAGTATTSTSMGWSIGFARARRRVGRGGSTSTLPPPIRPMWWPQNHSPATT